MKNNSAFPSARSKPFPNCRQDIELLRLFCIFGIIWVHANAPQKAFGFSCLFAFLTLSVFLSGNRKDMKYSILKRGRRLLVPWAFWFIVYGIANYCRHADIVSLNNGLVAGILSGTSLHLWYLPYIFICLVVVDIIKSKKTGLARNEWNKPFFQVFWEGSFLAWTALNSTSESSDFPPLGRCPMSRSTRSTARWSFA